MIRLVVGPQRVSLETPALGPLGARLNPTPEDMAWLTGFLAFRVTEWQGGRPESKTIPLCARDGSFPGGLLKLVEAGAAEARVNITVRDARIAPCRADYRADIGWLRPYQVEALHAIDLNIRGIVKIGTGGGKGELVAALPKFIPTNWTVLVHRSHLLADLASRFEKRTGEKAGRIGAGVWDQQRVTFATLATLSENLDRAKPLFDITRGVIVDECHVAAAATHADVLEHFRNAHWYVGLSGTPLARGDRRSILVVAHLGPMIYEVTATELIEMGSIQEPRIRMIACPHEAGDDGELLSLPWHELYQRAIVKNDYRNALITRALVRSPGPRMAFVTDLAHGDDLTGRLHKQGMRVRFAKGDLSLDQRQEVIAALKSGALDAAVATSIFNEGVDIPCLRTVGIAAGMKAVIPAIQRVGRVTRTQEGKEGCDVWDIDDRGHPTLEQHARARRRAYIKEGYKVETQDIPVFSDSSGQGTLPGT